MSINTTRQAQRENALSQTAGGPPSRTQNPFFGVGPITDMTMDEIDARQLRLQFDAWLEENYPKRDDKGNIVGKFTTAEFGRGMHRGYPADKVLVDMMREIHRYFGFPVQNKMAVGLGGGHSGFTVCALHLINANNPDQQVFVDTPRPESEAAMAGGFFRQSWGAQLLEMHRYAKNGDESRVHYSDDEGRIPTADELEKQGITLFFGVGHETTGATTYSEQDVKNLLEWIDRNPEKHHAVIDGTSMLGAMPWAQDLVEQVSTKCCMFMPFQKAIGGISGYFVISLTPPALAMIDENLKNPSWAIPRQLKMGVPTDAKRPLSSDVTTALGPIYDPEKGAMQGGIINTFSTLAFAETTFGLLRAEKAVGSVQDMNQRSIQNREAVNQYVAESDLLELGVASADHRGAAVTLLKVTDAEVTDPDMHALIIAKSKQLLGYEGLTHPNGDYEPGLDVARYVNAFPGTPGDYRAWIGGIRPQQDITALLANLEYAYIRAKIVVLEEQLAEENVTFDSQSASAVDTHQIASDEAYKVLVADLVGLKFDANGKPDHSEVKAYVASKGGVFHDGAMQPDQAVETGKIHFFYQPDLSREEELLNHTADGQYDATIVAATFLPAASKFRCGGVRIGAGTGNMGSASWGGGNGDGGEAPLMNTPSFNSRATAQMAMKALLKVMPDLPVDTMHQKVIAGDFDTGKNLADYPTEKLEGKRLAVIGYGNIGRELAKLAKAFGMQVCIYARPAHQTWIESEGFEYADSIIAAAKGADVISPHTGLGALNAQTGVFANANLINADVFAALNKGAVVVNYDRGEVVNATDLSDAMASGQVRYAAIDADLFKAAEGGELSGPMVPYLALADKFPGQLELLPHAAADTEHVSRVEGAKQAVDQIFDVIQNKRVVNLKGDLPEGYTNAGAKTVNGIGKVTGQKVAEIASDNESVAQFRAMSETMAAFWGAIEATQDPERRANLIHKHSADMIKCSNAYRSLMEELGGQGPYQG